MSSKKAGKMAATPAKSAAKTTRTTRQNTEEVAATPVKTNSNKSKAQTASKTPAAPATPTPTTSNKKKTAPVTPAPAVTETPKPTTSKKGKAAATPAPAAEPASAAKATRSSKAAPATPASKPSSAASSTTSSPAPSTKKTPAAAKSNKKAAAAAPVATTTPAPATPTPTTSNKKKGATTPAATASPATSQKGKKGTAQVAAATTPSKNTQNGNGTAKSAGKRKNGDVAKEAETPAAAPQKKQKGATTPAPAAAKSDKKAATHAAASAGKKRKAIPTPKELDLDAPSSDDDESDFSDLESASDSGEVMITPQQQRELDVLTDNIQQNLRNTNTGRMANGKAAAAAAAAQAAASTNSERGIVYIGRLPWGFTEKPMRRFFQQFGEILNLRVSRNRKTGKSKHFAFVEFVNREVADIVANTMNRYMMFGHTIICNVLPPEKIHDSLFCQESRNYRAIPWDKVARHQHNNPFRTMETHENRVTKLKKTDAKRRKALAKAGIVYEFDGYASTAPAPASVKECENAACKDVACKADHVNKAVAAVEPDSPEPVAKKAKTTNKKKVSSK